MEIKIEATSEKLSLVSGKPVGRMLIKRLLSSIVTLFLLVSLLFILIRISPGNPTQKIISAKLSPELSGKITEKFMLNKPVAEQYFAFLSNAAKGDLGVSYNYNLPVMAVVWEYFSFTLVFSLLSICIQFFVSYILAAFVTKKQNKFLDTTASDIALFIYSVPAFVLGVILIYLFSVKLNIFPVSGLRSIHQENLSFFSIVTDQLWHLILPLVTLSVPGIAMFYKYLKESINDVLKQAYILNIKATGLDDKIIFKKHVIPNALRPLISVAGIEFGILLGGTLITEVIFSLPGMGRLTIDSILSRDYPLIVGCVLTAGASMILANILADIVKIKIDKRLLSGLIN